jgi:hypothetical protein
LALEALEEDEEELAASDEDDSAFAGLTTTGPFLSGR